MSGTGGGTGLVLLRSGIDVCVSGLMEVQSSMVTTFSQTPVRSGLKKKVVDKGLGMQFRLG